MLTYRSIRTQYIGVWSFITRVQSILNDKGEFSKCAVENIHISHFSTDQYYLTGCAIKTIVSCSRFNEPYFMISNRNYMSEVISNVSSNQ